MKQSRRAANPQWNTFLSLARELSGQDTPEAQCRILAEKCGQILSARVQVWLASPPYPNWGMVAPDLLLGSTTQPLAQAAFQKGQVELDLPRYLAVPLIYKDVKLGVLQAESLNGGFRQIEIDHAQAVAFHAGTVMETTRLEALKNWYFEQIHLVQQVAAQIAILPGQDDLYERVTRLIQETFEYDYVAVFTLDPDEDALKFRGSASQNDRMPPHELFTVQRSEGIIGTVGNTGVEIVAPDVNLHPQYRHLDVLADTRSEAALPLKVENRILGVLDFQSTQVDAFQESDMVVLRALADHIALSIESRHLTQGLERRAEQISSVFEISHAITSILDLDELLSTVVRMIQSRFDFSFVHVFTVHPGRQLVIYQTGVGELHDAINVQGQHYPLDAPKGIISWVARSGRTFLSNDVTLEPLFLPSEMPPFDTHSELAVPLIHGSEVLGVLDIQSRSYNAFDEKDISLFEALAAPIAVGMRNASLYRSEQWRRQVAESFRDVAQLISANLPLSELLDVVLEKLESNLPCDASAIWLVEDDLDPASSSSSKQRIRLAATRNIDPEQIFEALQERSVQEMLEQLIEQDHPSIRRPGERYGPLAKALKLAPNYSSINAPMRTNNQPLGVISLAHNQEGRYGSEAQAITATFASYAAVAIQNARLYNETQEQALISTMLLQVSEASQTIMTLDDLLATMLRLTRLLVGVKKCAFLLWDDGLQSFELKSWYGFEPEGAGQRLFSAQLPGLANLNSRPGSTTITIDDPAGELDLPEMYLEGGTIMMFPLTVRGVVIGAYLVGLQTAWAAGIESGFDPKALAILQGIAHQTGMTIDNLRLLEARQEEAYVTAALLQVAQAVVSSTDLNDTLDGIVHLLPILVGINTCIIYLWDASSQLFRPTQVSAQNRREEEQIISLPFAPGEYPMLDEIRQTGQMHICKILDYGMEFPDWTRLPCQTYDEMNAQSVAPWGDWFLGYPLTLQDHVYGVLLVRETNTSPVIWERRLEILNGIAQQISLAIQNDLYKQELVQTERIEREMQLARQIQETFLPESLPQLDDWELDLRWEPAREVGGDFYDSFILDDQRIALVIADVADKGIPAAMYMTVARTLIRANAGSGQPPADVMLAVNKLLMSDSDDAMFITAIYAILTPSTGELIFSNAGHNLPLVYRQATQQVEQAPKGGTALGVLDDPQLRNQHIIIQPGDVLLLFTDGVTDLLSPDNLFFGDDRLHDLVQEYGSRPPKEMLDLLDDAFIEFRRGLAPIDDITLLAVRRNP